MDEIQITQAGHGEKQLMRLNRGTQIRFIDGLAEKTTIDAHLNEIAVGSAPGPYHVHRRVENFYFVVSGTLTLRADNQLYILPAGSAVFIPAGHPHSASNNGDVPLELLEIYAPAGSLPDFEAVPEVDGLL